MRRYSTSFGTPALGWTTSGSETAFTARSTAPSSPSGPEPQFSPQAIGMGQASGNGANIRSIGSPEADSSCPTIAAERTKGTSGNCRIASAHASTARRVERVSKRMKSAPPSRNAIACSRIIAATSGRRCCSKSGPIEPATKTVRPAASATSRASRAPWRLISTALSSRPYFASDARLAPKVLVVSTSAPASA